SFCLVSPFTAISVFFKEYLFAAYHVFTDNMHDSYLFLFALFYKYIYIFFKVLQRLCNDGVKYGHGTCTVRCRTYSAELKFVTGKGKRRRSVTVGIVKK